MFIDLRGFRRFIRQHFFDDDADAFQRVDRGIRNHSARELRQPRMTDRRVIRNAGPMPLAEVESLSQAADFGSDGRFHDPKISDLLLGRQATYCYRAGLAFNSVDKPSISEIFARNLKAAMATADAGKEMSQSALGRLSGVPQTTISLYLRPADRLHSDNKVTPSPTLERVAKIAAALRTEPWLLLHPDPDLAHRAHAVVAAALKQAPQPMPAYTLHEPYKQKKPATGKRHPPTGHAKALNRKPLLS